MTTDNDTANEASSLVLLLLKEREYFLEITFRLKDFLNDESGLEFTYLKLKEALEAWEKYGKAKVHSGT